MNLFDLNGKTVLITGGYGYLGGAMALGVSEHQANVCVLARTESKFREAFGGDADRLRFIPCDIAASDSIKSAVTTVAEVHGSIDVLINNAMYCRGNDPLGISDDDWTFSVDGVISSVYRCIREVAPIMKQQASGSIINVSSMYGIVAPDFAAYENAPESLNPPHYGAGKAAVIQLTKYYAQLLGSQNVRVNSISPGPFPNLDTQKNQEFINALAERTSLGRIGRPEELIGAAVYLSSNASSYVTGQNLVVDGGWTIT